MVNNVELYMCSCPKHVNWEMNRLIIIGLPYANDVKSKHIIMHSWHSTVIYTDRILLQYVAVGAHITTATSKM